MMDEMEEQGYPEDEIEEKVAEVRKELTDKMTKEQARLTASNDSHSRAEAQQAKNDRAAAAFGIKAGYVMTKPPLSAHRHLLNARALDGVPRPPVMGSAATYQ